MRKNRLRELLAAGEPTLGTHLLSCWPTLVELIGASGQYDYVELTLEYAPFTLHDLDHLGRAFEVADLGGMLKIEQSERMHQAMRAIGSGFQSVLFADIRSVEDARECVSAVRAEVPGSRGLHGVGMRRDVGTMRDAGKPAYVKALDDVVVAIMVEKRACVDDLEAILAVGGIDMVQFGPADYAMSIGVPGEFTHPDVRKAERSTIEVALAAGVHPRAELFDAKDAPRYLEMGVKHFCVGWDVSFLNAWWRSEGAAMRVHLQAAKSTSPRSKPADKRRGKPPSGGYR